MCVCAVSVTTLAVVSLISTLELNYEQLYHGILNSWILIKMFRSEVMASFATPQAPQYGNYRGDVTIVLHNAGGHCMEYR